MDIFKHFFKKRARQTVIENIAICQVHNEEVISEWTNPKIPEEKIDDGLDAYSPYLDKEKVMMGDVEDQFGEYGNPDKSMGIGDGEFD
jgi:hypothetical protein